MQEGEVEPHQWEEVEEEQHQRGEKECRRKEEAGCQWKVCKASSPPPAFVSSAE